MSDGRGANHVGRALLFERLVKDPEALFGEPVRSVTEPERRVLDRGGLRASVLRELRNVLGTRCPLPAAEALGRARTTIDYGLPALEPRDVPGGERYLVRIIQQAIEAYEPRIQGVDVEILGPAPEQGRILVRISFAVVVDDVREPVSFVEPIAIEERHAG